MEYQRFGQTVYLRIDKGEEITEQLKEMALRENIRLAGVSALNAKLPGYRIRYRKNEGYRLVTEHA